MLRNYHRNPYCHSLDFYRSDILRHVALLDVNVDKHRGDLLDVPEDFGQFWPIYKAALQARHFGSPEPVLLLREP
jgi:hypothetical protein